MVQTAYGFNTPIGQAGGLYDLSPVEIDAFINEAADGELAFGMGAVQGSAPGTGVALPTASTSAFEGIVVNRRTTENNDLGVPVIKNKATVGVLRYGRAWARLASGVTPSYGAVPYLVLSGTDAGCFTTDATSNAAVKGRFLTPAFDGIAAIELFNPNV